MEEWHNSVRSSSYARGFLDSSCQRLRRIVNRLFVMPDRPQWIRHSTGAVHSLLAGRIRRWTNHVEWLATSLDSGAAQRSPVRPSCPVDVHTAHKSALTVTRQLLINIVAISGAADRRVVSVVFTLHKNCTQINSQLATFARSHVSGYIPTNQRSFCETLRSLAGDRTPLPPLSCPLLPPFPFPNKLPLSLLWNGSSL